MKHKDGGHKGIGRVMQHKGEKGRDGHHGKMNNKPSQHAEWKRPNNAKTPRKA